MGKGQGRQARKESSPLIAHCPPEQARACGISAAGKNKCSLARTGEMITVYQRDGGKPSEKKGIVSAVISSRRCSPGAIEAYIPPEARPATIPTSVNFLAKSRV